MLRIADSCPGDNGTVAKSKPAKSKPAKSKPAKSKPAEISQQLSEHLLERRQKLEPRPRNPHAQAAGVQEAAAPVPPKQKKGRKSPPTPLQDTRKRAMKAKTKKAKTKKAKPKATKAKVAPKQRPAVDSEAIPFVFVPLWLITSMGASTAVVLLARMIYWLTLIDKGRRTRLTPMPKDRRSWGPGHKAIIQQTGLTGRQVDGALKILTRRKRIEGSQCAVPGSNHRLIRFTKGFHQWLCKEPSHLDDRSKWSGVKVRVTEIVATDNIPQALLLAVILNRFERNAQGKSQITVWDDDGQGWRYNTRSQLAKETGLSQTQVKRALRGLREKELIRTTIRLVRTPGKGRLGILHVQPGPTALAKAHKERSHG